MKATKECRVCGKSYEACHTQRPNLNSEFRWREICCSPECGQIWLERVIASRTSVSVEPEHPADVHMDEKPARKTRKKATKAEEREAEPELETE